MPLLCRAVARDRRAVPRQWEIPAGNGPRPGLHRARCAAGGEDHRPVTPGQRRRARRAGRRCPRRHTPSAPAARWATSGEGSERRRSGCPPVARRAGSMRSARCEAPCRLPRATGSASGRRWRDRWRSRARRGVSRQGTGRVRGAAVRAAARGRRRLRRRSPRAVLRGAQHERHAVDVQHRRRGRSNEPQVIGESAGVHGVGVQKRCQALEERLQSRRLITALRVVIADVVSALWHLRKLRRVTLGRSAGSGGTNRQRSASGAWSRRRSGIPYVGSVQGLAGRRAASSATRWRRLRAACRKRL